MPQHSDHPCPIGPAVAWQSGSAHIDHQCPTPLLIVPGANRLSEGEAMGRSSRPAATPFTARLQCCWRSGRGDLPRRNVWPGGPRLTLLRVIGRSFYREASGGSPNATLLVTSLSSRRVAFGVRPQGWEWGNRTDRAVWPRSSIISQAAYARSYQTSRRPVTEGDRDQRNGPMAAQMSPG